MTRARRAGPEGPGRITEPPRRRSVAEVQTVSDGWFDIAGLGQQEYEFFAMHASLGRVTAILQPSTGPVVLRLEVPKRVQEEALSPSFVPIPSDAEETSIRVRVGSPSSPRPVSR